MQANINDISYSADNGLYSALNAKLYVMDAFEAQLDDGISSQSTLYDASLQTHSTLETFSGLEEQLAQQSSDSLQNFTHNIAELMPEQDSGSGLEQPISQSALHANSVDAAVNSSAAFGINQDAVEQIVAQTTNNAAEPTTGSPQTSARNSVANQSESGQGTIQEINSSATNTTNNIDNSDNGVVNEDTINQVINSTETLINNTIENVNDILSTTVENTFNEINNLTENILENELVEQLTNVVYDTTNLVEHTLYSSVDSLTNITYDLVEGTLGKIEILLDVDLALDTNVLSNIELNDLSGTFSDLNNSIVRNVLLDVGSDLIDFQISSNLLENEPIVQDTLQNIEGALGQVDQLTSDIPLFDNVNQLGENTFDDLPIDIVSLGLTDNATLDPNDGLSIDNVTTVAQDLGTDLLTDDNILNNDLSFLDNDEGLEINDMLSLDDNTVLNTDEGLDDLVNNLNTITNDAIDDLETDTETVSNAVDDTLNNNIVENVIETSDEINAISDELDTILSDNSIIDTIADLTSETESTTGSDSLYDVIATTTGETINEVYDNVTNDVDLTGDTTGTDGLLSDINIFDQNNSFL